MNQDDQTKIEHDASNAIKVVADAAAEATKVVAVAAAEAVRTSNVRISADHDLLIELKTKMDSLKEDIKNLSDGTTRQISDHEVRLNALEKSKTAQNVMMSIGIGILTLLVSLLVWHMVGR